MSASGDNMSASLQQAASVERAGTGVPGPAANGIRASMDRYNAALLRQRLVNRTIEAEIVPRLVLNRRGQAAVKPHAGGWSATEADVVEFARLVLARDASLSNSFIAGLRARGASIEALYLDLFTPAARRLGWQWEEDDLDFMQVTEGLGRMQHALHELSPSFVNEIAFNGHGRRALLVPAPGEQHTFGLSMVSEFFRRAGWNVWTNPAAASDELVDLVRAEWFTIVGFSVLCDASMDALAAMIRLIRRASRNRSVRVMVGGPAFVAHPEMAAMIGADATAADGRLAVLQAQNMLAMLPGRD